MLLWWTVLKEPCQLRSLLWPLIYQMPINCLIEKSNRHSGGTHRNYCCHPWSHQESHRGSFASSIPACNITWSLYPWAGDLQERERTKKHRMIRNPYRKLNKRQHIYKSRHRTIVTSCAFFFFAGKSQSQLSRHISPILFRDRPSNYRQQN